MTGRERMIGELRGVLAYIAFRYGPFEVPQVQLHNLDDYRIVSTENYATKVVTVGGVRYSKSGLVSGDRSFYVSSVAGNEGLGGA